MTGANPNRIDRLRSNAANLNELTDTAAAIVREAETFLNEECSLGVHTEVTYTSGDAPCALAYVRVGSRYRIAVIRGDDSCKPWSDSSRMEKFESLVKLPDLLDAIIEKTTDKLDEAKKIVTTAAQALKNLKGESL